MFGNAVTDGTRQLEGAAGYIITFDLSNQRLKEMIHVQAYDDVDLVSTLEAGATALGTLMTLPFSADAPTLAWTQVGHLVYVFLKTSVYGYDVNTRIAFLMKSSAARVSIVSEKLPGPSFYNELAKALIARGMKDDAGTRPGYQYDENVRREKARLGL